MYVIEHKWYVLIECWKMGLYWQGIIHDLWKFSPAEFGPYARYFYDGKKNKEEFDRAWKHHYTNNPHHWDHWVTPFGKIPVPMPVECVKEMIADWKAMGRKFGDTAEDFYIKNWHRFDMHHVTRKRVRKYLNA
jgi:hypothetical protein